MRPSGATGRVFGWLMERMNAAVVAKVAALAALPPGASSVELGFGTGALVAARAAQGDGLVAGVDPSPLMLATATRRTAAAIAVGRVDLRLGDASTLPWPQSHFDAAFALHSWQFWADPAHDLAEVMRVLKPSGAIWFALRAHGSRPPDWLPNPISRSRDEAAGLLIALGAAGFGNGVVAAKVGSSVIVTARAGG
ncbi:MAG: class I SAM-dependent methyltransferase [Sphingomonas sp.]